jgi:hypothetical protein
MTDPALTRWAQEICPAVPIDIGVVRAVKVLRDAGLETFEACEAGEGHAYAEPTVRFEGDDASRRRALEALAAHGLKAERLSRTWDCRELRHRYPEDLAPVEKVSPFWEVTFRSKLD